ncbi:MAG: PIG-L deacetylase family protein [Acidobacteriota bacterium]
MPEVQAPARSETDESTYTPQSAVIIVAHPDDIEYSCGGTLALWAQRRTKLCYVLCTSGEAGIDDPAIDRNQAREIREAEQRAAAEIIGAEEVIFLREPDGLLAPSLALRKRLVRIIRRFRPEVVVTGDPTLIWTSETFLNHPDHRAASLAALEAAWPAAGQRNLYPDLEQEEGLGLHRPRKLYCTGWVQPEANLFVDIETTLELKAAALQAHKSQTRGNPEPLLRRQAAHIARGREIAFAESFRVTTLVDDARWQRTQGDRTAEAIVQVSPLPSIGRGGEASAGSSANLLADPAHGRDVRP